MESRRADREQRQEERKGDFKKGITGEEATEKRAEDVVRLRKAKREQQLKRVRHGANNAVSDNAAPLPTAYSAEQVQQMMVALQTGTPQLRREALQALRAATAGDEPHLALLHSMHVVAVLQKVLTGAQGAIVIDALWCLTNLASGAHDTTVPLYPAIPYVVHLLGAEDAAVADQAAWCLGNIGGDCVECRQRVIAAGAVVPLTELLKRNGPQELFVTLGFTICNLVRAGGALAEFVKHGLIALVLRLLTPAQPLEVVVELMWVLTYVTAGDDTFKANVVSMGGVELLVQLCAHPVAGSDARLMVPLMRTIGNLCSAPDAVVLHLISNRAFLEALWARLGTNDNNVLREVCWALNNLSGGPFNASAALVQCGFVPPLAALLNGAVMSVRKEVGFVLINMASALRREAPIVEMLCAVPGVVSSFVEFINLPDLDMIAIGLRWASLMLRHHPHGKALFEEHAGLIALEDLEYNPHKNEQLFSKANELLQTYFTEDDEAFAEPDEVANKKPFAF